MTVTNWQCDCGFDLQSLATDEANAARTGQRHVMVTCPVCENIYDFNVIWTATVLPTATLAVKVQGAAK